MTTSPEQHRAPGSPDGTPSPARRAVDVAVAGAGLLALAPLFAVVAIAIKADSRGPVFYRGARVGLHGEPFRMWKFRTMTVGADKGSAITAADDARVTRVGAALRRTKLDELPQLLNVLAGDMTLFGPRPEVPHLVDRYRPEHRRILEVMPGVTGPGQLHYTTDQEQTLPAGVDPEDHYVEHLLDDKLQIDLDYLARQTWRTDLALLFETVGHVVRAARSSDDDAGAARRGEPTVSTAASGDPDPAPTGTVLFVAGTLGVGGAERQLSYMLRALADLDVPAEVVTFTQGEHWEGVLRERGVSVTSVGASSPPPVRLVQLLSHVRRRRPALLQASHAFVNPYVAVVGAVLRIPVIGALRNDPDDLRRELGRLTPLALRSTRLLAANSQAAIDKSLALGVPAPRLRLLENAVDTDHFTPLPRPASSQRLVLGVGRLVPGKRFDRWLQVFAAAREAASGEHELLGRIVGAGPEQASLESLARDLGVDDVVTFVTTTDVAPHYQEADVLLFSSDGIEGTPNVVMEAMASALPIAATDVGGVAALVTDGETGLLADAGDDEALLAALTRILVDPTLAAHLGAQARAWIAEHRSIDALGRRLLDIHRELRTGAKT